MSGKPDVCGTSERTDCEPCRMTSSQKRIFLWAVPRSLSAAMCRVMMNSGLKTKILYEIFNVPYYFAPGRTNDRYKDINPDPKYSYENAKHTFELPYPDKELVFAKDLPYYLSPHHLTVDWIPDGYTHTFLTRHPRKTVASYLKVVEQELPAWPSLDPNECGYKEQVEMFHLVQQQGHKVVVLDGDDLMHDPEGMLRAYCREVGLEYRESMINWEPLLDKDYWDTFIVGPRNEPQWHQHARTASKLECRSSCLTDQCFDKYGLEIRDLAERTVEENMKYYEELHNVRLVV